MVHLASDTAGRARRRGLHLVSEARFVELRDAGTFLEWAVVFGDLYGTGRPDTEARLASGEDLVLVITYRERGRSGLPVSTAWASS